MELKQPKYSFVQLQKLHISKVQLISHQDSSKLIKYFEFDAKTNQINYLVQHKLETIYHNQKEKQVIDEHNLEINEQTSLNADVFSVLQQEHPKDCQHDKKSKYFSFKNKPISKEKCHQKFKKLKNQIASLKEQLSIKQKKIDQSQRKEASGTQKMKEQTTRLQVENEQLNQFNQQLSKALASQNVKQELITCLKQERSQNVNLLIKCKILSEKLRTSAVDTRCHDYWSRK